MYYKARFYNPGLGRFMQTDPIGYDDDVNLYAYVGNDPLNRMDPSGLDSMFVARPISWGVGHHAFILITTIDSSGRHTIRQRFSFGARTDLGTGGTVNLTGSGRAVDLTDAAIADAIIRRLNNPTGVVPATGVHVSTIDAPDNIVEAVGNAVLPNDDYDILPGALPGSGVNSNSAPVSIAERATAIAGNDFALPEGASIHGANNSHEVRFDEEQLSVICKAERVPC